MPGADAGDGRPIPPPDRDLALPIDQLVPVAAADALPALPGRAVTTALERAGFEVVRTKGSHHFLRHRNDPSR